MKSHMASRSASSPNLKLETRLTPVKGGVASAKCQVSRVKRETRYEQSLPPSAAEGRCGTGAGLIAVRPFVRDFEVRRIGTMAAMVGVQLIR